MYYSALAQVHDQFFKVHSYKAEQYIRTLMPEITGPIVDLGCGSGDFLAAFYPEVPLAYGYDISPAMIDLAKTKVPAYHWSVGDLFAVDPPPAQVYTLLGEILCYATAHLADYTATLQSFFEQLAQRIQPGGLLLFDVITSANPEQIARHKTVGDQQLTVLAKREGDLLIRTITVVGPDGQQDEETHHQRVFDPVLLQDLLARAGWEAQPMNTYGTAPLLPGRTGFLCRTNSTSTHQS